MPLIRIGIRIIVLVLILFWSDGFAQGIENSDEQTKVAMTGADRLMSGIGLSDLVGKKVALVGNHSSLVRRGKGGSKYVHLLDTLRSRGVNVVSVFSPEHGFRGLADAGAKVAHGVDSATGIPVYSLYGANKKPSKDQLKGVDVVVFDLQDVGCRFYTYISTLELVLVAAAEVSIPVILLDRPNLNMLSLGGPVLDTALRSFVGMQPVPILYGMSIGEYAKMITGERWYVGAEKVKLKVIDFDGLFNEQGKSWQKFEYPVAPSPNLQNSHAIRLYPSLCLFEGTAISVGRGTTMPFEVIGAPFKELGDFTFVPRPGKGDSKPMYSGQTCYGMDLSEKDGVPKKIINIGFDWSYLIKMYNSYPDKSHFFTPFFDKLAGNHELRKQIEAGMSIEAINNSWNADWEKFLKIRSKYIGKRK